MHRDTVLVEREQDRLGLDALDAEAQEMGGADRADRGRRSARRRDRRAPRPPRRPAPPRHAPRSPVGRLGSATRTRRRSRRSRHVLETTAAQPLLGSADDQRVEPQPAAHEQRARTLRPAELVRGDRAQVGSELGERHRHVPDGRARVDVHERTPLARPRRPRPRVGACRPRGWPAAPRRARCRAGSRRDLRRIEAAGAVDADRGHVGRSAVPRRGRPSARPPSSRRDAPVVATSSERAPRALLIASVPDAPNTTSRGRAPTNAATCSRVLDRDPRRAPFGVQPAGVAVVLREVRQHRLERDGPQRRRRRVVEVRAVHTRVTQCRSPSGRLSSMWGCVAP